MDRDRKKGKDREEGEGVREICTGRVGEGRERIRGKCIYYTVNKKVKLSQE